MSLEIGKGFIPQSLHLCPGEGQSLGRISRISDGQDGAGGHPAGGVLPKGGSAQGDVSADGPAAHGGQQTKRQPAHGQHTGGEVADGDDPFGSLKVGAQVDVDQGQAKEGDFAAKLISVSSAIIVVDYGGLGFRLGNIHTSDQIVQADPFFDNQPGHPI